MNVRKPWLCVALAVVMVTTAILVGCPKKTEPPADTSALPESSATMEAEQPEVVEVETGEPVTSEVVLTKELLDQWLACAKDEETRKVVDSLDDEQTGDDPASLKAALEGMAANAELEKAVKAHGFESAEQWAAVSMKVMAGLFTAMSAEAKEQMAEMGDAPEVQSAKAEMDKQLAAFEETFGELTEDEQTVVDEALDDIKTAME